MLKRVHLSAIKSNVKAGGVTFIEYMIYKDMHNIVQDVYKEVRDVSDMIWVSSLI